MTWATFPKSRVIQSLSVFLRPSFYLSVFLPLLCASVSKFGNYEQLASAFLPQIFPITFFYHLTFTHVVISILLLCQLKNVSLWFRRKKLFSELILVRPTKKWRSLLTIMKKRSIYEVAAADPNRKSMKMCEQDFVGMVLG